MQFLWFVLSFFIALFTGIGIILFVVCFGACYELIKCYNNKGKKNLSNSFYDQETNYENYEYQINISSNREDNNNSQKNEQPLYIKLLIYIGLIILGLCIQIFYLGECDDITLGNIE